MINKIMYKILAIQEKILRARLAKTIGIKNTSKKKRICTDGCTIDLSSLADLEKKKLEDDITDILKKYNYSPKELLNYISQQGTRVIYDNNSGKILNSIGENEGFIYPAKGQKALYLSLSFDKKFALHTPEMFILPEGNINQYYFIYHFYNWYAFKHNISGIDTESQELLKKYLFSNSSTNTLQLSDIYKLKEAIQQDKAAIEFVTNLCKKIDGTKQALDKIHNTGSLFL